jgi:hypothetical protein
VLKERVFELEAKIQPRIITPEQETNFIGLLKGIPSTPIRVFTGTADVETDKYAKQIRILLDAAGFTNNEDVVQLGSGYLTRQNYMNPLPDFDIELMEYGTNMFSSGPFSAPGFFITPSGLPVVVGHDPNAILSAVKIIFEKIGVKTDIMYDNYCLKPGEVGIFVPEKVR